MSCDRYSTGLIDVALGEPGPEGFAAHLRDCRDCRATLEQEVRRVSELDGQLRAALAAEPSPWFQNRVRQRVVDEARGGQRGARVWKWAAPALVALGLALVVFPVLRRASRESLPAVPLRQADTAGLPTQSSRPSEREASEAPSRSSPPSPTRLSPPPTAPLAPTEAVGDRLSPATSAARSRPPSGFARATSPDLASTRREAGPGDEPEVLIPPEEAAAVRRFVSSLRGERVGRDALLLADAPPPPLTDLAVVDLAFQSLTIESLGGS